MPHICTESNEPGSSRAAGIPMISYLYEVRGVLHNLCIFFRYRSKPDNLDSGIARFEHIQSRILEKEKISPDLVSASNFYEPIPLEKDRCSLETADRLLFISVMATRGDMSELLLAESSDSCYEETDCR
jgi:hypothetical protein